MPINPIVDTQLQREYPLRMSQIPLFETAPHWTVTELTRYLRQVLEADSALQDVWVQGEISNFSRPSSGHLYFTLKDSGSSLRCVVWKTDASRLRMSLQDGVAVEAHGAISVYEVGGQYQLYVNLIKPVGEGALYQEFLRLKALLEAEGLFDPSHKRPIPEMPRRIGIITSPTGAALRDMLNTLRRRLPLAEVVLAPSPVQGDEAPARLVVALNNLNDAAKPDVILIARGGGSMEDLWAFNDERVVRTVAKSRTPVISGVGHETDFTLTDFAADLRAPTPTAAAELATPITIDDLKYTIRQAEDRLIETVQSILERLRHNLGSIDLHLRQFSPVRRLQTDRQRLDDTNHRMETAIRHRLELSLLQVRAMDQRLTALSPLEVLKRGYAVVNRSKDGKLVHSVNLVKRGDGLRIRVTDGTIDANVKDKEISKE
jgi:exodeoxyribonuclease VII large subunit